MINNNLGYYSEFQFIIKCLKLELNVSSPTVPFLHYDFIVESKTKRLYKIQVKSSFKKSIDKKRNCYHVKVSGANNRKYDKLDVDFFAVYLFDIKQWYLIPVESVNATAIRIYPEKEDHIYSKFKESWQLIV